MIDAISKTPRSAVIGMVFFCHIRMMQWFAKDAAVDSRFKMVYAGPIRTGSGSVRDTVI
jgi:hypothetical protein